MSLLQLMSTSAEPTAAVIRDPVRITAALAEHGARFEQWPLRYTPSTPDEETIRRVYTPEIERFCTEGGLAHPEIVVVCGAGDLLATASAR